MYRILIADDEGIVIDSLTVIIERNFGKSCRIESAKTGRGAIELAEQFRPDILFMDIQMPGINGIDAIAEIKKNNMFTQFIILSAYDKFDYAKKALQLGVFEYMMKPFNSEKIVTCLEKVMTKVERQREQRSKDLRSKEKLETVIPIIESGFIYHILFGEQSQQLSQQQHFLELLDIKEAYGYMMVMEYGDDVEQGNLTNPIGVSVKAQIFYQELREIVKEFFDCIAGPVMANRVLLLVPCTQPQIEYNERIKNINRARDMLCKLRRRIDAQFRLGIGSIQPIEDIQLSYQEAQKAMKSVHGSVIHIKDLHLPTTQEQDYLDLKKRLLTALKNGNMIRTSEEAIQLINYLIEKHHDNLAYIKGMMLELMFSMSQESNVAQHMADYYIEVAAIIQIDQLKQWFIKSMTNLVGSFQQANVRSNCSSMIDVAIRYINQNYHKDLSLEEVSRTISISPYYFSKIFKEEMGINFIEYLTNFRVEKAKQLLASKQISIKEVCLATGYSDPNYFSRIFKKSAGLTPTEYREKC